MGGVSTVRVFPHKEALQSLLQDNENNRNAFCDIVGEKFRVLLNGDVCNVDKIIDIFNEKGGSCDEVFSAIDEFFRKEIDPSCFHFHVGVAVVLVSADVLLYSCLRNDECLPYSQLSQDDCGSQSPVVVCGDVLLDASLVAAQKIKKGLSFKPGGKGPDNVFLCDYTNPTEFNGEDANSVLRAEIWASVNRRKAPRRLSSARFKTSMERVDGLIVALNKDFAVCFESVSKELNDLGAGFFVWRKTGLSRDLEEVVCGVTSALDMILSHERFASPSD